jgi:hypothetical protein
MVYVKAKYIAFNCEWHKDCAKCGNYFASDSIVGLTAFFARDSSKSDKLDAVCKKCRASYRIEHKTNEQLRWKRYYAPGSENRKRHVVRSQTRRKFGSAKQQQCIKCNNNAEEWHHVLYKTDAAIPLCRHCHRLV